jgi:hypothetical protein
MIHGYSRSRGEVGWVCREREREKEGKNNFEQHGG